VRLPNEKTATASIYIDGMAVRLTSRERQLVAAILAGSANGEIARSLGLKEQTVKNQLVTLYRKTGTSTRLELALFAIEHGFQPAKPNT
jgi:DNA-binding NarL/FixJ family response regulator